MAEGGLNMESTLSFLRNTKVILKIGALVFLAAPFILACFERQITPELLGLVATAVALCLTGVLRLGNVIEHLSST